MIRMLKNGHMNSTAKLRSRLRCNDIMRSFIIVLNKYMNTECINARIELTDMNSFFENYLYDANN
jgi:hypothetical protein